MLRRKEGDFSNLSLCSIECPLHLMLNIFFDTVEIRSSM
mgnify:CR=1 FL=1